ncbi:MAG: heavy metal translocating P-type ATPase [Elusimicrobiota bacterium]|nr:heavy metal translocating P-type ATPase [Elusimicrobiota bacterium]
MKVKQKFNIDGMTCSACSFNIEKNIRKLDGIVYVNVNLIKNIMFVEFDDEKIKNDDIIKAVIDSGYNAYLSQEKNSKEKSNDSNVIILNELTQMKLRLYLTFIFLIPLIYISMGHMLSFPLPKIFHNNQNNLTFAFTQFLLILPIIFVNLKYYQLGFKTLFKGHPNMDSLIAIGSSAAISQGIVSIYSVGYNLGHNGLNLIKNYNMDLYFESAAMILALISLGKYLELLAKHKTSAAITKLMDLSPKKAIILKDGLEKEIPIEEVNVGDTLIVKSGQSIPTDGIISEGSGCIDEAALTGESMPTWKTINDKVIGATINKAGYFKMKALKIGEDTTFSCIIKLVEEASSSKAPISKLVDKISGIFVPIVIIIAFVSTITWFFLGYPFSFALSIGIAVLIISCPCALGLATPTAIMVGTGKAAQNGILIKSAESLEILHKVKTIVLDKTGTLTQGAPKVTDIIPSNSINEKEFLIIASSLEKASHHPFADAIIEKANEQNIKNFLNVTNFEIIEGQGIKGEIDNKKILAGNLKIMKENNIFLIEKYEKYEDNFSKMGKTTLYFARDNEFLGIIVVADTLKSSSKRVIDELKAMNISIIMLTGDNEKTAEAIKNQLNIDKVIAEVLPQDKDKEIRNIQAKNQVAMVGDGINDAPALARADVGIAIGAGTDIAIESADIVLIKSDLLDVVYALQLSKAVIKNIKQNLFWAFFYNCLGIPLAAGIFYNILGWKLNPMFAAGAMSLSSICVVLNALRLKLFKPEYKIENNEIRINNYMETKKTIIIEGMSCEHCSARIEKLLNEIDGVIASVDLDKKRAFLNLSKDINDEILKKAIENAGYKILKVE